MTAGRPEIPIDWDLVDEWLEADCSAASISRKLGIHRDTLTDRLEEKYKVKISEYSAFLKIKGDDSIKKAQFDKALGKTDKGDNTLLIWLGKIRLKQKEEEYIPLTVPNQNDITKDHKIMELENRIAEMEANANKSKTE